MKKTFKAIGAITGLTILLCSAYWLGTTQANTVTAEMPTKVVPDGYIKLDECIPLEDIAYFYTNENGYLSFELKDIGNQLDNPDNKSYEDIMKQLNK